MKTKYTRRIGISGIVLFVAALAAVIATGYRATPSVSGNQKLQVVAAENFWGSIVSQIGGDHVEVTSIVSDPGVDPHLYESNARDAASLARADLVINNGLGYDDFMDKLLSVSSSDSRQVLSVDQILTTIGDNPNPHLWYDIPRVSVVAEAFEQALAAKDPKNTKAYETNLVTFKNSLKPILDGIQEIKTKYPNAPVAYTERVPGYLLTAAGLDAKTPAGFAGAIEEGNDPSPADTAAMDALMTNRTVRVLLYNPQATSSVTEHVRDLAGRAGIPVVGVTETLPKSEPTYQSWQLNQVKSLLRALEG